MLKGIHQKMCRVSLIKKPLEPNCECVTQVAKGFCQLKKRQQQSDKCFVPNSCLKSPAFFAHILHSLLFVYCATSLCVPIFATDFPKGTKNKGEINIKLMSSGMQKAVAKCTPLAACVCALHKQHRHALCGIAYGIFYFKKKRTTCNIVSRRATTFDK